MIQAQLDHLNEITNQPLKPYERDIEAGRSIAQIGNYHLSHAYGGVCVHQMANEGGGVRTPLCSYHEPKRDCYEKLVSFISGINTKAQWIAEEQAKAKA